jgi:hypothetical protein
MNSLNQKINLIRNKKATISSRRYGSDYEKFIGSEGRNLRRKIDVPDPSYKEGYEELEKLTNEVLNLKNNSLIIDYLSSLEVDLDYYELELRDLYNTLGFGLTQISRQYERVEKEIARVVSSFAKSDSAERILYNPCVSEIEPAVKEVYSHLIKEIAKSPSRIFSLKPRQFETIIAEILDNQGWLVELTAETHDGGYDIFAVSKKEPSSMKTGFIVECKLYSPQNKVGIEVARQLLHVKSELHVPGALIVTSSDFTSGVYNYAANRLDFDTKNFNKILEWCRNYKTR